ncbi:hypothetical protein DFS34DRAFT_626473 [Phlyctochytrium arcticum]|nr:hypothetical protein DFS34DRAFT_626473 [Phlyctochytrium arcticum]
MDHEQTSWHVLSNSSTLQSHQLKLAQVSYDSQVEPALTQIIHIPGVYDLAGSSSASGSMTDLFSLSMVRQQAAEASETGQMEYSLALLWPVQGQGPTTHGNQTTTTIMAAFQSLTQNATFQLIEAKGTQATTKFQVMTVPDQGTLYILGSDDKKETCLHQFRTKLRGTVEQFCKGLGRDYPVITSVSRRESVDRVPIFYFAGAETSVVASTWADLPLKKQKVAQTPTSEAVIPTPTVTSTKGIPTAAASPTVTSTKGIPTAAASPISKPIVPTSSPTTSPAAVLAATTVKGLPNSWDAPVATIGTFSLSIVDGSFKPLWTYNAPNPIAYIGDDPRRGWIYVRSDMLPVPDPPLPAQFYQSNSFDSTPVLEGTLTVLSNTTGKPISNLVSTSGTLRCGTTPILASGNGFILVTTHDYLTSYSIGSNDTVDVEWTLQVPPEMFPPVFTPVLHPSGYGVILGDSIFLNTTAIDLAVANRISPGALPGMSNLVLAILVGASAVILIVGAGVYWRRQRIGMAKRYRKNKVEKGGGAGPEEHQAIESLIRKTRPRSSLLIIISNKLKSGPPNPKDRRIPHSDDHEVFSPEPSTDRLSEALDVRSKQKMTDAAANCREMMSISLPRSQTFSTTTTTPSISLPPTLRRTRQQQKGKERVESGHGRMRTYPSFRAIKTVNTRVHPQSPQSPAHNQVFRTLVRNSSLESPFPTVIPHFSDHYRTPTPTTSCLAVPPKDYFPVGSYSQPPYVYIPPSSPSHALISPSPTSPHNIH